MSRRTRHPRGLTLPELLVAIPVVAIATLLSVPALAKVFASMSLRAAAHEVAAVFSNARMLALVQRADHGVKWVPSARDLTLAIYRDGNGNGVLTADIQSGVDRLVFGPVSVKHRYPKVTFSFVMGLTSLDPGGRPIGGSLLDPIRFGNGDICTFTPLGDASPGSVYLSDGTERQALVRVSPFTGRILVYEWCKARRTWIKPS